MLDVGLAACRIEKALASLGLSNDGIEGILLTHEHTDHIKSIRAMSKRCGNATVVSSMGTADNTTNFACVPENRIKIVSPQDEFSIGDIRVKAFSLSHDARQPISYTFSYGGQSLSVVTDTGIVTDEIFEEIKKADMLVLEANHEVEMLRVGPYPYNVKRRILSDIGHLSNEAAGITLSQLLEARRSEASSKRSDVPRIMLAHLSSTNNTPDNAGITVRDTVHERGFDVGVDYRIGIAARSEVTDLYGGQSEPDHECPEQAYEY